LLVLKLASLDLWRVKDFASDLLVLKLASLDTVEKLCLLGNEDEGSVGVLCAALYFMPGPTNLCQQQDFRIP
jgi:hypothetical protein